MIYCSLSCYIIFYQHIIRNNDNNKGSLTNFIKKEVTYEKLEEKILMINTKIKLIISTSKNNHTFYKINHSFLDIIYLKISRNVLLIII